MLRYLFISLSCVIFFFQNDSLHLIFPGNQRAGGYKEVQRQRGWVIWSGKPRDDQAKIYFHRFNLIFQKMRRSRRRLFGSWRCSGRWSRKTLWSWRKPFVGGANSTWSLNTLNGSVSSFFCTDFTERAYNQGKWSILEQHCDHNQIHGTLFYL